MAAAARNAATRALRLTSGSRFALPRASVPSVAQRACLSYSAPRLKSEVIKESEVPVSVYSPDHKGIASSNSDHFSIPVKNAAPPATESAPEDADAVTPLQEKVYRQMPRTLQKMSVHGKVIIVTG